jgi:hypothetical protein
VAGDDADLRDARAHRPESDHADFADRHGSRLIPWRQRQSSANS